MSMGAHVISISSPLPASAAADRIRALVSRPVARTFSLAHGLHGRVEEAHFTAWYRSPLQRYPLVRARGEITPRANGCQIVTKVPIPPHCPGFVAAVLLIAFLVTFALAARSFFSASDSATMPAFVPATLGAASLICLMSL